MAAVLHYVNQNGHASTRSWKVDERTKFNALIKFHIQDGPKLKAVEKPCTRPASFAECQAFANKLIKEYGEGLKQLIVWNLDAMNSKWRG